MNTLYIVKKIDEIGNATVVNIETKEETVIFNKLLKENDKFSFIGSDIRIYHDERHKDKINKLINRK